MLTSFFIKRKANPYILSFQTRFQDNINKKGKLTHDEGAVSLPFLFKLIAYRSSKQLWVILNKMCTHSRLICRKINSILASTSYTFQQPGHILSQYTHGLQTFLILTNIVRGKTVDRIPILRRYNRHVANRKILIDLFKSGRRSSTST